jgi:NAD(P)-dependent dehydrogenase (short-subunit alcohol dehydrogenase family)
VASASNADWDRAWRVNVMAHVYAARAALPAMIARRSGYFVQTVSAAGLLSQIGAAAYSTTKHAAIGFAESLAITHRDHGVRVSVVCPQAVETAMIAGKATNGADVDGIICADVVADAVIEGLAREAFLILPHPEVSTYMTNKAANYERWLGGMSKLRRGLRAT